MNGNKPSIILYVHSGFSQGDILNNILWGIEEEGIPYEVINCENESGVKLAYRAALDSRLDVGIGIGSDENISLHYAKLDENSPLYTFGTKNENHALRMLGANAARLVKGIPFKVESDFIETLKLEEENSEEIDISSVVAEVMRRMRL